MGHSKRKRGGRKPPVKPAGRSRRPSPQAKPHAEPKARAAIPWWVPAGAVLAMLVLVFHKALLMGMAYAPPDVIGGARIVGHFVKQEAAAGRPMPLWCPYIFGGMPTVGSLMWAPFYPLDTALRKLFEWLPSLKVPLTANYLHHLLGALWTYLLLRHLKTGKEAALLGAVAFSFSPYLVVLTPAGHGGKLWTASYLPLLLLTVMRLYDKPTLARFAVAGLAMGAAFLANHPQIAYYEVIALGLYWAFRSVPRIIREPKTALAQTGLLAGVIVTGALMAAVVYLPTREYAEFSIRGEGAGSYDWATSWSFHPGEIITFAIPSFFGFGGQTYWGHMPFTEAPNYLGVTVLLLATVALRRPLGRTKLFLVACFLIALVVSFGRFVPLLYAPMYHLLPYFKRFRVPVLIHLLCLFSAGVLAALGLDEATRRADGRRPLIPWLVVLGAVAAALVLLPDGFKRLSSGTGAAALADSRYSLALVDTVKAFVLALALYGALGLKSRYLSRLFPVALVVVDLAWVDLKIAEPHHESFDEQAYFSESPLTRFLKQEPGLFRILPVSGELTGNKPLYYGLSSLSGYSPARLRVASEVLDPAVLSAPAVLNMLNCRYVLSGGPLRHPPDWEEVFRDKGAVAYRNKTSLPRAWLVGDVRVVPGKEKMLRQLADPAFDPAVTALVYVPPPSDIAMTVDGEVEVTSYTPNRVELRAWSGAPTYVVLSEMYYPAGWRAYLDGNEIPILQTNHALRGIALPPGDHQIVMEFRPGSYFRGRDVSLATAAGLLVCLTVGLVRRSSRSRR
jgi:hypothetical protein